MSKLGEHEVVRRLEAWLDAVEGEFRCREQVEKFLADERMNHPVELADLADMMLTRWMTELAGERLRLRRRQNRASAFRDVVESNARAMVRGERPPHSPFDDVCLVDGGLRKRVGEMNGADHRFVACSYAQDSKRKKLLAAFHDAVAKRVGPGLTADVMSVETYQDLYVSIVGRDDCNAT